MMSKSFVFDVDGTLVDSNDFHALAWEKAFLEKGKTIPLKRIRHEIGKGSDQFLPVFLSKKEIAEYGKELDELQGMIFMREYFSQVRPFPKVRELFKAIRDAGGKTALASSSDKDHIAKYQTIAQLEGLVDECACADDAEKTKPAPDIFQVALQKLGNPSKNSVIVVGDTPHDAQAARKIGLPIIGVRSGGFAEADLKSNGCFAVYEDPADILANLPALLAGTSK
jgi:HAD superfamily hydrolase (TIGR01549 family)